MCRQRSTTGQQPGRHGASQAAGDAGVISAFLVAAMLGLLVILGLGLDPGLAFAAKIRALGQAEEAARDGAQQIDLTSYRTTGELVLDPVAAQRAAEDFLTKQGEAGIATATATKVTVTITTIYKTTLWQAVGVDTVTVSATGSAVPHPTFATGTP